MQSLSHFAASFIDIRAEASIAKSCKKNYKKNSQKWLNRLTVTSCLSCAPLAQPDSADGNFKNVFRLFIHPHELDSWCVRIDKRVNDPSAGSPTETLLRLLLPLSDKVHLSLRGRRSCLLYTSDAADE